MRNAWRQCSRRFSRRSTVSCEYAHRITSNCEGNTTPGAVARASRALAVGNAEQAASRSKAADQDLEMHGWPDHQMSMRRNHYLFGGVWIRQAKQILIALKWTYSAPGCGVPRAAFKANLNLAALPDCPTKPTLYDRTDGRKFACSESSARSDSWLSCQIFVARGAPEVRKNAAYRATISRCRRDPYWGYH